MLFFTSDNGPENKTPGSTAGLRARKRSLYEGGIRVPGLWEWPAKITTAKVTDVPAFTSDYYPTILEAVGFAIKEQTTPMDGESILGLVDGSMKERLAPMGFELGKQLAYIDNQYKIRKADADAKWELYDLTVDAFETNDLAASMANVLNPMVDDFTTWRVQQTVYGDSCCTPEPIVTEMK